MKSPYYGGTGITLEKLKEKLKGTISIDGTHYPIDTWLKECAVFENLVPGKSKVWIPYGGMMKYGTLNRIEWNKLNFKGYSFADAESQDWWIYEPVLIVDSTFNGEKGEWYIYEYTAYYENFSFLHNLFRKEWYTTLYYKAKWWYLDNLKKKK